MQKIKTKEATAKIKMTNRLRQMTKLMTRSYLILTKIIKKKTTGIKLKMTASRTHKTKKRIKNGFKKVIKVL